MISRERLVRAIGNIESGQTTIPDQQAVKPLDLKKRSQFERGVTGLEVDSRIDAMRIKRAHKERDRVNSTIDGLLSR